MHAAVAFAVLWSAQLCSADFFRLPPFDTVAVQPLGHNKATILLSPSSDGSYTLNATQKGLSFTVTSGTLELMQGDTNGVNSFLDDLFSKQEGDEIDQQGVVYVGVGGPLTEINSAADNDVVVGSNFTTASFAAKLSGSGNLVALTVLTPKTVVENTGSGTIYVQGDLGTAQVSVAGSGGAYLGASAYYPGSISSADVQSTGTGDLIIATSSGATNVTGLAINTGRVFINQGICNVRGPNPDGSLGDVSRCEVATIRVPLLQQYWHLSDSAKQLYFILPALPPPPPSPPPPVPRRNPVVTPAEVTNLVTPLRVITPVPAPAPALGLPLLAPRPSGVANGPLAAALAATATQVPFLQAAVPRPGSAAAHGPAPIQAPSAAPEAAAAAQAPPAAVPNQATAPAPAAAPNQAAAPASGPAALTISFATLPPSAGPDAAAAAPGAQGFAASPSNSLGPAPMTRTAPQPALATQDHTAGNNSFIFQVPTLPATTVGGK